jgi:phospholipid/cholesterol/gamma-HCH transport system permease protein
LAEAVKTRRDPQGELSPISSWFHGIAMSLGEAVVMVWQAIGFIVRGKVSLKETIKQMAIIGADSLPMVSITGLFTGMVLVVQMGNQFVRIGAESYVGGVVALALARELSPNLTAIVTAGRVGSAMAAEIGTMKVTEQVDALYTLATSPVKVLVSPRLIASVIMLPLLTVFSTAIGIAGGAFVAVNQVHISLTVFKDSVLNTVELNDLFGGLLKAAVFGLVIAIVGCYRGFTTEGGAEGVGRATTGAVVNAIMCILVSNYFLTVLVVNFVETFLKS